ncbi:amino-acid N-acetyltransferase [Gulosibacter bifidus]|uniref:Amino-acid N-acetyltransferase n=1 Tax=Gulosibacter bifidus TaxID=272239 RepID=A0ABW5RKU8_9MICO|nr:amino-acid N-acetyltransferase [Gulosibacter bifidus]
MNRITTRRARTADVVAIHALIAPYVEQNIILRKDLVVLYEAVQEFIVAEDEAGTILGCGALHVLWRDLGEIRTVATHPDAQGKGVGGSIVRGLVAAAKDLGLERLFCLTFETDFFAKYGFAAVDEHLVDESTYKEMLHSPDAGMAEFLDLPWVKPNTLGNTRMLMRLA